MATTMNRHSPVVTPKVFIQKVCIVLGIFFIVAGLGGIVMPGLLGMHLSLAHNIIHLASGALALWFGYSDDLRKAYTFCVAFGVVYCILGLAGFVFGREGFPSVGNMVADQKLLRIIPNILEYGTMDHIVHALFGAAFIVSAIIWKRRHDFSDKLIVTRRNSSTSTDLKDPILGRSDINRSQDVNRRADFETRI